MSIWTTVTLNQFNSNVARLYRQTVTPGPPRSYSKDDWLRPGNVDSPSLIDFETERQVADDLAFVSRNHEGVGYVAAVGIEQPGEPPGLTIRVAANDGVSDDAFSTLQEIATRLQRCACKVLPRDECASQLLDLVVRLNQVRIHGRLCSTRRTIPTYLRGAPTKTSPIEWLSKNAANLSPRHTRKGPSNLQKAVAHLYQTYLHLEAAPEEHEAASLKTLLEEIYQTCSLGGAPTLEANLLAHGVSPALANSKEVRDTDKLGHYYRTCLTLAAASRTHRRAFSRISVRRVARFPPVRWASDPTVRAKAYFVHAEVQLVVFYAQHPELPYPRIIGASKAACYLCDLFVRHHARFFLSATHGRLFDEWTVPDPKGLATRPAEQLRLALSATNDAVKAAMWNPRVPRPHPPQSVLDLNQQLHMQLGQMQGAGMASASTIGALSAVLEDGDPVTAVVRRVSPAKPLSVSTTRLELFFELEGGGGADVHAHATVSLNSLLPAAGTLENGRNEEGAQAGSEKIVNVRDIGLGQDFVVGRDGNTDNDEVRFVLCSDSARGGNDVIDIQCRWIR